MSFSMIKEGDGPTQPPGDKIFSVEELAKYDGTLEELPIYLAVKGTVFDVSKARGMYTGKSGYKVFAGKDASKALGKSSLKIEDCIADYSELTEDEMATLDKWHAHYTKKYNILGSVDSSSSSKI